MLVLFAGLMTLAGLVLAGLAGYVAWKRGNAAGASLAVLLVSRRAVGSGLRRRAVSDRPGGQDALG